MALKSTVHKFALNVADMDRQVYGDFALTLARHPSETEGRMMLRLLAFALNASEGLEFGRGISTDDEPDLWCRDLTGHITLWIDLDTPDPERLRKACGRADRVLLYCYGDRATPVWWEKHGKSLQRFPRLQVYQVADASCELLEDLGQQNSDIQCIVEGGYIWVSAGGTSVEVVLGSLKSPAE